MCSVEDLRQISALEFRTEPTGNWTVSRNGRRKMETIGKEYVPTSIGKIERKEWYRLMEEAVKTEKKSDLLLKIETYVKKHCAWLRTEMDVREYAMDCLSSNAYTHWKDFSK